MTSASDQAGTRPQRAPHLSPYALLEFTQDAFLACGLPADDAAIVADAMIEADLTGQDGHGIFRLASYVQWLQAGRVNPRPRITVTQRAPATAMVDGDNGMGHLVMSHAARKAIELAREAGVGWVGTQRSNHAGAGGVYAAMPLAHNLIGIYGAASSANHMAPWGGAEPLLGTNPIAVAIPAGKEAPVVLDIATSVASFGDIRTAALEGRSVPEGWMIGRADGAPLTDPRRWSDGLLLPIGTYKGSGLALAIGLIAGVLNGGAFGRDIVGTDQGTMANTGQFIIALDVARFMPPEAFAAEVDRHVRELHASARLPGVDSIRLPGEGRQKRKQERSRDGVELTPALLKQLDELAARLKLRPLRERSDR